MCAVCAAAFQADIILMCANAKVYNHPSTKPHKEAVNIFNYSMKYVSDRCSPVAQIATELSHPLVTKLNPHRWCMSAAALFGFFLVLCGPLIKQSSD